MWKKSLFAAAVGGFLLSARAADRDPAATPPTAAPQDDDPAQPDTIRVEGHRPDAGFKADDQVSGKLPLTLRETPQSISVLTRESLDDRQVFSLQQAFELSAGVTQYSGNGPFAGQPSFGFNQTTIRGIAVDDLYDFRDDGFVSGSFFSVPDLAIYERIEVVKGPNSVLYGRGSVGGLINRVRKKPLATAHTELELSAGSFDTYRADLDVTGPLLSSKRARGRLVAAYEDSGSFVRGAETQRTVLAPSVDFDLTASTRLLLMGHYQSEDIVPNTGLPLQGVPGGFDAPDISRRRYNGVVPQRPYTWKIESAIAQLEQDLGDRWLAALRLSSSNIDTPLNTDGYVYGFRDEGDDPTTADVVERRGDTSVLGNDFAIDRDVWSGELQLTGSFEVAGKAVKASFGADHNDNAYSRRGMYTGYADANLYDGEFPQPDPELFPGATFGGDPRSSGAFAQAQIQATQRLKVLVGARYDDVQLRSFDGDVKDSDRVDDVTGRIGLTWDLNRQVSLYTLYAQSFQPVLFDTDINGELLDPETGEIFEVGAKTEWFDGRLGLSTALYRIDREDVPVGVDLPPGEDPYSVSSGLQRSEGFEVEVNGRPVPGWDLSLALSRVDSEFKDPDDPFFGNQPGGTADWQVGFYNAYAVQAGPLRGLGAGLTAYAIDDRGVSTFQTGTIPGYERLDLHAFYKGFKDVEINLLVRNLTDEHYIEGADRRGAYAQFGSPTAMLLSVKYTL
ncbi:TonB-dependent siderophore receptor [Panacagrimonas sp.]|uniref:TonB-dependent siderophore receptor n=1 Tax=Panacagrimonas sp. TaxID=2480088 RepID=UPI003B5259DF